MRKINIKHSVFANNTRYPFCFKYSTQQFTKELYYVPDDGSLKKITPFFVTNTNLQNLFKN